MSRYIFDIETNGLLDQLDRVHSLVMKDIDTGQVWSLHSDHIFKGVQRLAEADEIIGHNIIGFDIPALQKVYPWFDIPRERVTDTLVLSKLYEADIKERDVKNHDKYPKKLFGRHSLEAWGYRLGDYKGDFKGPWDAWTPEMQSYCEQDVEVTHKLYKHLRRIGPWSVAERLEHDAAWLCAQIERNGIPFDVPAAAKLYAELVQAREKLSVELKGLFQPWAVFQGEVLPKTSNSKIGFSKGVPYSKIKINEFNPQSRDHIIDRLKALHGWVPIEFTDKGKPKVDEKVLHSLPYPAAAQLAELFLIMKRIGQVGDGPEAWLTREKNGWIHYRLNSNGAVTGRATHSKVNITQVPKVGSRWGAECRALWGMIPGGCPWPDGALYGVDVAGLELRCLAHYMAKYDGGEYGRAVIEGKEADGTDVHSLNAQAIGLEPQTVYNINGKTQTGRNCAKTFIYAFLYGAGPEKIGKTIGKSKSDGLSAIKRFLSQTPALASLKAAVSTAAERGYLQALDGRHMPVRSKHAALNTLLQGAGAIICKAWIVETDRILREEYGLKHGWDGHYAFLIWAHDELQIACRGVQETCLVADASAAAIKNVEKLFKMRVSLSVGGKAGKTWKDTH